MHMQVKTMEFKTLIAAYDYDTKVLKVKDKSGPGEIELTAVGVSELKEALEGIGHQVPSSSPRPHR